MHVEGYAYEWLGLVQPYLLESNACIIRFKGIGTFDHWLVTRPHYTVELFRGIYHLWPGTTEASGRGLFVTHHF